ncbi:MAG: hypothetical protein P4L84_01110 [Isosphaeraceae bacterium]|nr:hypothetical protein [Isosphaeraceae bacterium]
MATASPRPVRRSVPAGFLGMLALVLLIESFASQWCALETRSAGFDWWLTNRRAQYLSAHHEVLCFGDSQMKLDVQPEVVEPLLGRSVLNLSVIAGEAPSSYFLLRRAIDSGARPKAVVVDFFRPLLAAPLALNHERWPLLLSFSEALELALNADDPDTLAHWLTHKALPTYAFRNQVRARLKSALGGQAEDPFAEGTALRRNSALNQGAIAGRENPAYQDDVDLLPHLDRPLRFACSNVHVIYFRKFLALAQSHRIPVYLILSPCSPNWQRRSDQLDPDKKYEQAIRREIAAFPGLRVIDGRHSGYDRGLFLDKSHLDHRGAAAFSADLAEILRKELGDEPTRHCWITMPAYRPSRPVVDLETLNESSQIVRLQSESLRR